MRQTKQEKTEDKLIDRVYRERCTGMEISVMRIPELFKLARLLIRQGTDEQVLGDFMVKFVEREKL